MFERLFRKLAQRFDPEGRVTLLLSSEDPELAQYLDFVGALGSAYMGDDGRICVKIHNAKSQSKVVLLEELAHALQFMRYGNIPLSSDDRLRHEREFEVASCLFARAARGHFSQQEINDLEQAVLYYG